MLTAPSLRVSREPSSGWLPGCPAQWGDDRKRYSDASSVQALAGTSPVPEDQWQLRYGPSPLCLRQAEALRLASVCLGEYAAGSVGQGQLRAQTPRGQES